MVGRKRAAPGSARGTRSSSTRSGRNGAGAGAAAAGPVPDVVREMLREVTRSSGVAVQRSAINMGGDGTEEEERPLKRRRPGERPPPKETPKEQPKLDPESVPGDDDDDDDEEEEDEDLEFEDVILPPPPTTTVQTVTRDSEDEDDDEDDDLLELEDVVPSSAVAVAAASSGSGMLDLNLSAQKAAMVPSSKRAAAVDRRKPATREEKDRRVLIHKMHLLCLLAHVELRNRWCNDPRVQETLGGMVTDKIQGLLNPRANLPQYSKSESLKRGLTEIGTLFRCKYLITERGLRRALWAEDPEETLGQYKLPDDTESTFEKSDFLDAAKTLRGSRDVGAQLFCALLRSAGVETRLVCSLQPLACAAGSPAMPKQRHGPTQTTTQAKQPSKMALYEAAVAKYETNTQIPDPGTVVASPRRRRLGHPNATAYHVPNMTPVPTPTPQVHTPVQGPKVVKGESMYPVYWVEVLDKAYQKWQPVDPLVTHKQFAPKALEPPAADTQNCLSYAVAFDTEGCVKDVTRRYARAYNSKTRRLRVDGVSGTGTGTGTGEKWWRRALRRYRRLYENDLDQIEETELAAEEAKEPMPKNVADFKDHPVYALERHLRRHEVLVPDAQTTGTIKASTKGSLERIYRRRDVRVARSRDKWYRLGRVVKVGEEPVKILPKIKRKKGRFDDDDDEQESEGDEERDPDRVGLFGDALLKGTPIYSIDQTDLYEAEPVVNGRIPKNKFGNIDIYVPSMAPRGGVHIIHERAAQAAYILGVDYAPALTGFKFSGRTGTAVLSGVVVAQENEEGVRETIQGLEDMDEELEQERRSRLALRMWSRLLKGLRIRERIWANNPDNPEEEEKQEGGFETDKGKGKEVDVDGHEDLDMQDAKSDVSEEYFMGEDEEGGGFLIE